jgi:hypothetical protein
MGPSSSLLISFFLVFLFCYFDTFFSIFEPCVNFLVYFGCLLNGETLIFEIKKAKKKLVFGLQLWSILRYFGFFSVFIQFLFFVRSISGDNYMRYIVQQEVWSACFQREPWFASQKNHHSTWKVLHSVLLL